MVNETFVNLCVASKALLDAKEDAAVLAACELVIDGDDKLDEEFLNDLYDSLYAVIKLRVKEDKVAYLKLLEKASPANQG